jgi:hypothetical protein
MASVSFKPELPIVTNTTTKMQTAPSSVAAPQRSTGVRSEARAAAAAAAAAAIGPIAPCKASLLHSALPSVVSTNKALLQLHSFDLKVPEIVCSMDSFQWALFLDVSECKDCALYD